MSIAISQVLASLEPCFYARSIVRMAVKRLTKKNIPLVMITPTDPSHLPINSELISLVRK